MTFFPRGESPLDYHPCRYGTSKLLFRGPRRKIEDGYVAVIGGTETYGRFIERPFPALVEADTGQRMINLGYVNAGIDVFLNDQPVIEMCAGGRATVIQLLGAQNLTNRFYAVHPRRNDRFLAASQALKWLYRDVDFTEFNFTRHLLAALQDCSPDRFTQVALEIKTAWSARMRALIRAIGGTVILLWIGEEPPGDGTVVNAKAPDPLFVTRAMIDELRPLAADVVEVVASARARAEGTSGLIYSETEESAATTTLGISVHRDVADALAASLARVAG